MTAPPLSRTQKVGKRPGIGKPPASVPAGAAAPALIVLGPDAAGKPHAAWFTADEATLARRAATLMDLAVLEVASDALRTAAAVLPHGRVFAAGRAFVPFVKRATYETLAAHLPVAVQAKEQGR